MGKKGHSRSTAFSQGSNMGTPYRDTVMFVLNNSAGGGTSGERTLTFRELLPGLSTEQSGSRTIIPEHFIVEVQPDTVNVPGVEPMAQVQFLSGTRVVVTGGTTGFEYDFVAQAPYKLLSKVNPTQMGFSVKAMARRLPTLLRTFDLSRDDESRLPAMRLKVEGLSPSGEGLQVRVTTRVLVVTQLDLLTVPPPTVESGKAVEASSGLSEGSG